MSCRAHAARRAHRLALAEILAKYIFSMHRPGRTAAKPACFQADRVAHAVHVFACGEAFNLGESTRANAARVKGSIESNLTPAAGRFS